MSSLRMRSALFLGVALLALGCSGSDSTGPSTGNVQVSASTTGADLDPDGYTVAVDGGAGRSLAVNGTVTFSQLSAGDHTVTLSGSGVRPANANGFTAQVWDQFQRLDLRPGWAVQGESVGLRGRPLFHLLV